eukprot:5281721-Prymnesium_polylepis.2
MKTCVAFTLGTSVRRKSRGVSGSPSSRSSFGGRTATFGCLTTASYATDLADNAHPLSTGMPPCQARASAPTSSSVVALSSDGPAAHSSSAASDGSAGHADPSVASTEAARERP